MKIIYIAHPVGGDVEGNLKKITEIVRNINLLEPDVVPLAPYFADLHALNDEVLSERVRGMKNSLAVIGSGMVDEVWLFGDHVSKGMERECLAATIQGVPVVPQTKGTKIHYEALTNDT